MKTKKIQSFLLLFTLLLSLSLIGCGKKKEESVEPKMSTTIASDIKENKTEEAIKSEESLPEEKEEYRSFLSGEILDGESKGKRPRPYAYMFNNIKFAYPQTGTSNAKIIYEILAEGGITRLMGVFDQISGKRIGSVRSARHYYVDFAKEFDAFFIHFGQTKYAVAEMKKLEMDTLSGLGSESSIVFYRDNKIKAPHNAFASEEGIKKGIEKKGYRTELKKEISSHFNFSYDKEIKLEQPKAFDAPYLNVPFSGYMTPYFIYENGEYTRYAFGSKHIDLGNNKPLTFKNIFIQFVNEYNIDKNGYQTMDLIGFSGKAFYITNGKGLPVYWKKENADSKTEFFYDEAHKEEIAVNVGKSYYAVLPMDREQKMVFNKDKSR